MTGEDIQLMKYIACNTQSIQNFISKLIGNRNELATFMMYWYFFSTTLFCYGIYGQDFLCKTLFLNIKFKHIKLFLIIYLNIFYLYIELCFNIYKEIAYNLPHLCPDLHKIYTYFCHQPWLKNKKIKNNEKWTSNIKMYYIKTISIYWITYMRWWSLLFEKVTNITYKDWIRNNGLVYLMKYLQY